MKNIFTRILVANGMLLASASGLLAQNVRENAPEADMNPFGNAIHNPNPTPQTPWQVLFNYDMLAASGANGNAAVCLLGTDIWVSRWASDSLMTYNLLGQVTQRFTVAGVTGTRSLTTDGTSIFAGTNNGNVYQINPVTKTLTSTITSPIANVRSLTFDATANGNQGGFWASTWATDITQFDMSGSALNVVYASTHTLTGMYGTAFDNTSPGGPYLWVFDQGSSPEASDIVQIRISTGMPTSVIHDVMADVGYPQGDTSGLAGGLFFRSSPLSLLGVLQGSPTNRLFAYDIAGVSSGINDIQQDEFIGVYPNPANDRINIHLNLTNTDLANLQIINALGQVVYNTNDVGINNYFNISNYEAGVYFVKATYQGNVYTSRLVKQ
jgi:hypothetical protein